MQLLNNTERIFLMNIYGKKNALDIISSMLDNDRLAHSFLFYGEKGTGKKFFARYTAMLVMCSSRTGGKPCGKCRSCRNIMKNMHPDVIRIEHSGKLNGFSVDSIRKVCSEAAVFPNESSCKIYIFDDADAISVPAQNALLKTIEEPPEFTYFIFTASSKNVFLDTIISRIISVGISPCTENECRNALGELDFNDEDINSAVSAFGGNIGNCISFITDTNFRKDAELTKTLTDCIINNDEYGFLAAISAAETDRNNLKRIFTMLDDQIRDSIVLKFYNDDLKGCYHEGAQKLSEKLALSQCEKIHFFLEKSTEYINSNVSSKLVTAYLCRNIAAC